MSFLDIYHRVRATWQRADKEVYELERRWLALLELGYKQSNYVYSYREKEKSINVIVPDPMASYDNPFGVGGEAAFSTSRLWFSLSKATVGNYEFVYFAQEVKSILHYIDRAARENAREGLRQQNAWRIRKMNPQLEDLERRLQERHAKS